MGVGGKPDEALSRGQQMLTIDEALERFKQVSTCDGNGAYTIDDFDGTLASFLTEFARGQWEEAAAFNGRDSRRIRDEAARRFPTTTEDSK